MANINNEYSDYIRFYLYSESKPPILVNNIIGWKDYGLDSARNLESHGTLTEVSKTLGFTKESKKYIEDEFNENDALGNISLTVERLTEINNELKWVIDYTIYADFYTKEVENEVLTILFNSNNLMNKIEAYEDTEFEIGRTEDVYNNEIDELEFKDIELEGRNIQEIGVSVKSDIYGSQTIDKSTSNNMYWTPKTKQSLIGPINHSSVDTEEFIIPINQHYSNRQITSSNMFWVGLNTKEEAVEGSFDSVYAGLNIKIEIDVTTERKIAENNNTDTPTNKFSLAKYDRVNGVNELTFLRTVKDVNYPTESYTGLSFSDDIGDLPERRTLMFEDYFLIKKYHSFSLEFPMTHSVIIHSIKINLNHIPFIIEPTNGKFLFLHNTLDRLMYIISGKNNVVFSNILGKIEEGYSQDGELGLIGTISGLQSRAFSEDSEQYYSPKFSIKDFLDSICNTFNLGWGVELIDNKERLIVEDISYFYRNEVVGIFPKQITNVKRTIDESSYYSGLEFGYEKGGDYENEMGLDEPNLKSNFVTPINNTSNSFQKLSKIRADEYGLEILRRKPESTNPLESLSGDEDNWYLDLKRQTEDNSLFEQVSWEDRLSEEPTGIFNPPSFRSMFFTPVTILRRFSNIFNSGLYLFKDKFVNFASTSSNRNLEMSFLNEEEAYKESDNFPINQLKRPIFKNKQIEFNHVYSEELKNILFGKTKVIINGQERMIPNFYFKFEWLNENNKIERGYFISYEYSDNPTFTFQIANEEII